MSSEDQGFSLDPSKFEVPLHSLSLDVLLANLPPEEDGEGDSVSPVSFRYSPIGVLPSFIYLSRLYSITRADVTKMSTRHGYAILTSDSRLSTLSMTFNTTYKKAFLDGNKRLFRILENTTGYSFTSVSKKKTSISIPPYLVDKFEGLSEICGVDKSQIVILCNCLSLVTASGFQGWKEMIMEDVLFFWDWIDERQKLLSS